jgi:predicted  nucleic acid-binding Zn-ribbon protein
MKQTEFYCLKCKKVVVIPKDEIKLSVLKNGKHALSSQCSECDTKLFKFVKEDDVNKLAVKYKKSPYKTSKKSKTKKTKKSKTKKSKTKKSKTKKSKKE